MPLVVPGLQSKDGKGEDWTSKLMGKSLGDSHNETVSPYDLGSGAGSFVLSRVAACPLYPYPCLCRTCGFGRCADTRQTFAKQDLPQEHRVLKPDSMSTADFKPDRLNIHVGEDGTVQNVRYG